MAKLLLPVLALLITSVLSGCTGQSKELGTGGPGQTKELGTGGPSSVEGTQATPTVFDWSGHVIASDVETPTHFRPTEDYLWPVFQEGILFSVDELPDAMEVSLEWSDASWFQIMLHSHKDHGTNVYVEHVTELDDENPKCLRVPSADLAAGTWQVMVHSYGARQTDFTLHIGLLGGAGHIIQDDRHGHWVQDGLPEEERHEIEPCQLLQAPVDLDNATGNATVPRALPPQTHFAFGETLGCEGRMTATPYFGPACIEFLAGWGGTGAGIDGHWIQLDRPYWGLVMTSTIDQGGASNDSDCVFINETGIIQESKDALPCAGQVPEDADWLFIYPYVARASSMTVDFALPPVGATENIEGDAQSRKV